MGWVRFRRSWGVALVCVLAVAGGRQASAMSCGELRLMTASGVIGPLQSYVASARCGEEKSVDNGTKLTWHGLESSSTNFSFWMDVVGKASWDRKTGLATEQLKITGDATGQRVAKGICNQDPFLKDPPGGAATCHQVSAQYKSSAGPIYEWFTQPSFFLARTISLGEAQALSQQKGSSPPHPAPAPPPPHPMPHSLSSPSGSRVWEGEDLFKDKKVELAGGKLGVQSMQGFGPDWSGNAQLLWGEGSVGAVLDLSVDVKTAGYYRVRLALTRGPDFGVFQAEVDGKKSSQKFDGYSPRVTRVEALDLGTFSLSPGPRYVSLMIIGKNSRSTGYLVGIDRVTLTPAPAPAKPGEMKRLKQPGPSRP